MLLGARIGAKLQLSQLPVTSRAAIRKADERARTFHTLIYCPRTHYIIGLMPNNNLALGLMKVGKPSAEARWRSQVKLTAGREINFNLR